MTSVSREVARIEAASASKLLESQAAEFGKVLPAHVGQERFTRWALTLLRKPELARVMSTPEGQLSVMSALMDCAALGLEPGREYHLVPFGGQFQDGTPRPVTVTGVTDFKGEVRLITNAERCSVIAMLVHEKDSFSMLGANIPPAHDTADWFADRGPVTGGYAYVDYGGGRYSLVVRMNEAEFLEHRALSKKQDLWDKWPAPYRLKTLIHQVRKFVSWSPDWRP
jgi:recombinational DNA repair protein RecT